jgi:predicted DNA-binding antitoxin AbrB/MazE fold protein
MALTIEAVYENGVLKPIQPLPLNEHEIVRISIEPVDNRGGATAGIISCTDARLIEWAATDADLDYPSPPDLP